MRSIMWASIQSQFSIKWRLGTGRWFVAVILESPITLQAHVIVRRVPTFTKPAVIAMLREVHSTELSRRPLGPRRCRAMIRRLLLQIGCQGDRSGFRQSSPILAD